MCAFVVCMIMHVCACAFVLQGLAALNIILYFTELNHFICATCILRKTDRLIDGRTD